MTQGRISTPLGQRLRQLRQAQGKTLSEVATHCGFSLSYISRMECGDKAASVSALGTVARHYGTSLCQVLQDCEPPNLEHLPESLQRLYGSAQRGTLGIQMDHDDLRMLSRIQYLGRRAQREEDWLSILLYLRRVIG